MKKFGILLVLAMFALTTQSYAQAGKYGATPEDSVECIKYLSFYKEYYKNGNIREAIPSWRGAINGCPKGVTQALYQDGQSIIKFMINQTTDANTRKALVDSLIMMYDIRIEKFPTSKAVSSAYTYKAYDVASFCKDDQQRVYTAVKDAINFNGNQVDHGLLVLAMQYATAMFKDGKINAQAVIEDYESLVAIFDAKAQVKNDDALQEARSNFETIFAISGVADCDNLLALFGPQFDANATNVTYVKRVVQLLSNAGCETSELFLKAVEALYSLEPSANSAYYLYRLYSSKEDNENALLYLQKAANDEAAEATARADYYMQMGTFYFKMMKNNSAASESARKAMELNEQLKGKAYLLLGHIWANSKSTGDTDIDARANFWVAVDYFSRAKSADDDLAEECDQLIATYRQYFPTVEEAFMYDLSDGNSYTVSCPGLSATTTVRTRK